MRLLIDGTYLSFRAKGVGQYSRNVIERLVRLDSDLEITILLLRTGVGLGVEDAESLTVRRVSWTNHLVHGFRTIPQEVAAVRPDVLWMPYETPLARLKVPVVMLCHDSPSKLREAQEVGGGHRSLLSRLRDRFDDVLLGRSLRQVELVLSNTEFVRQSVASSFGVPEELIRLAPCAPGADFESLSRDVDIGEVRGELGLPNGYVLCIYTGDLRENLGIVPKIYDRLVRAGQPHGLVVAGLRLEDRRYAENLFASWPWKQRVTYLPFFGIEERLDLAKTYAAASVYLDPSLLEGFGMQVIEAMACGTAVVCSDCGALPEIAGDAALLADPLDDEALADHVLSVLTEPGHQAELVEAGLKQARLFTWQATTKVIHRSLLEVAGRSEPR